MCVFLDGYETPMIVQKRDGAFLYATTDLATIQYRVEEFHPDAILYVVGQPQTLHFEQLFAAARRWGYTDLELEHVSFGTVLGEDRRPFKTRSGDAVGLSGLLDEAVARAERIVAANDDARPNPELSAGRAPAHGRSRRDRRGQVRRPLPEPRKRLRLQLRQDARHEGQHGDLHAVFVCPRAEHLRHVVRSTALPCGKTRRDIVLTHPAERAWGWPCSGSQRRSSGPRPTIAPVT